MGPFLFQVEQLFTSVNYIFMFQTRLSDIQSVSLVDRRGYLTVVVEIKGEESLLIRRPEKLREWYNILHKMVKESKTRVMKSTEQFWAKKIVMDSEKMEEWLAARTRIGSLYQYTTDIPRSTSSMDRRQSKQKKRANSECEFKLVFPPFFFLLTISILISRYISQCG